MQMECLGAMRTVADIIILPFIHLFLLLILVLVFLLLIFLNLAMVSGSSSSAVFPLWELFQECDNVVDKQL